MPYKITNVATDHRFAALRARASRLQMEPIVAGKRLRLRSSVVLSDEQFKHNEANIKKACDDGVITVDNLSGAKAPPKKEETPAPAPEPVKAEEPKEDPALVSEPAPELTEEPKAEEPAPEPKPEVDASEEKPAKKSRGRRKSK